MAASNTKPGAMLQQEFDAWGLPSLRPYLNYLIDNKVAEHKLVQWGKGQRWCVIIGGKKYQYKGGHEFNKSLKNKIVSLYIDTTMSSKQKNKKDSNNDKNNAAKKIQKLYQANKSRLNKSFLISE